MKAGVVLLVVLVAGVAWLLAIKLLQEPASWEMNAARQIVPLDRLAGYAVAGKDTRVWFDAGYRMQRVLKHAEAAGLDGESGIWDGWRSQASIVSTLNFVTIAFLQCQSWARGLDVEEDPACARIGKPGLPDVFLDNARRLARAFLMEADGADPRDTAKEYVRAGWGMAGAIAGGATTYQDPERRRAAAKVFAFAMARASRIQFIALDNHGFDLELGSENSWCHAPGDDDCPGSIGTYVAIKLYLDGDYENALRVGLDVLESEQPWTYRSPYDHPLLWILAANRRGNTDMPDDLQPLIDAALAAWPEDARTALLMFVGADEAPDEAVCITAGCRYFLAQTHEIAGDAATAGDAIAAGLGLCDRVLSIPCTALRAAQARIDEGKVP